MIYIYTDWCVSNLAASVLASNCEGGGLTTKGFRWSQVDNFTDDCNMRLFDQVYVNLLLASLRGLWHSLMITQWCWSCLG